MKLWKRLAVTVVAGVIASTLAGTANQLVVYCATSTYRVNLPADALARLRAEKISDAAEDSVKLSVVIVPVAVALAWWFSKRRKTSDPSSSKGTRNGQGCARSSTLKAEK